MKLLIYSVLGLIVVIVAYYILIFTVPQGTEPQAYVSNITVLNSSGSNVNGVYVINGIVKNNNQFNITVVNLNASGYNGNGTLVDTGDGFTTNSPVAAGGTANFTISLYDPNKQVTTYAVQVEDASK